MQEIEKRENVDIQKEKTSLAKKRKVHKILWIVLGIFALLLIPGLYNKMSIRNYSVEADEISNPIRIALITDLHSCKYGDKEQELIDEINFQNPDIIALAGDFFDDVISDENAEYLLQGVADKYPCYYVTGNHEYWSGSEAFDTKMAILEKYNVHILSGKLETITVNGETINICGIEDTESLDYKDQLDDVAKLSQETGCYTILLAHHPELFESYTSKGFDLVLSGHAHGGQWRIPGILNGLYAPDQGLFPKYAGGMYQDKDTTMIVSRGLARESIMVPRIYNRPELVIIDVK